MEEDERRLRPVKALQHAIEVVDVLAENDVSAGMSVTELSKATGLSKTAVYNILTTLLGANLITQDRATSRYGLGWRWHQIGALVASARSISRAAQPFLRQLVDETNETALLAVLDGLEVTYPAWVESPLPVRFTVSPGAKGPVHCTATGKALLAYQPAEYLERLLRPGLQRYTELTIIDPDALREELEKVRRQGYGVARREYVSEHCSIAAPVRDHTGGVKAVIGLAGPSYRFEQRLDEVAPVVTRVAKDLEREVGGAHTEGTNADLDP